MFRCSCSRSFALTPLRSIRSVKIKKSILELISLLRAVNSKSARFISLSKAKPNCCITQIQSERYSISHTRATLFFFVSPLPFVTFVDACSSHTSSFPFPSLFSPTLSPFSSSSTSLIFPFVDHLPFVLASASSLFKRQPLLQPLSASTHQHCWSRAPSLTCINRVCTGAFISAALIPLPCTFRSVPVTRLGTVLPRPSYHITSPFSHRTQHNHAWALFLHTAQSDSHHQSCRGFQTALLDAARNQPRIRTCTSETTLKVPRRLAL